MLKFLSLILFIFLSTTSATNTCPYPCNGHPDTAYYAKNPRGCAWFFTCNINQAPREGRCPEGYLFNHAKQLCDFSANVECVDDAPVTTCPPFGIAKISHPDTCSKYVLCIDGVQQDRLCKTGLHYSEFHNDCVEPSQSDCVTDFEFCNRKHNEDTEGIFPKVANPRDCATFYICSDDNWVIQNKCYPGGHFNPATGFCEDSTNNVCDVDEQLPVVELPEQVDFNCADKFDGSAHPHPESCDFWFFCAGGRSYLQRCGTDAKYDINQNRCVSQDFDDLTCYNGVRSARSGLFERIRSRNQV
ncbi:hypothetical protein ACKWTF_015550 [Chironomus riparius]